MRGRIWIWDERGVKRRSQRLELTDKETERFKTVIILMFLIFMIKVWSIKRAPGIPNINMVQCIKTCMKRDQVPVYIFIDHFGCLDYLKDI